MASRAQQQRTRRVSEQRSADRRRQSRRSAFRLASVAATAAVALTALGLGVAASRSADSASAVAAADIAPRGLVDGGVVSGPSDAPVRVVVYEDLQCPACRLFEQTAGPVLAELQAGGDVRVERRPLAFLDNASTDRYSSRAMNAVGCVADRAPAAAPAFMSALFDAQPAEGGPGLTDPQLAALASASGAGDVATCVTSGEFAGWVRAATTQALTSVDSTPTVTVNGRPLDDRSAEGLRAAVGAARPGQPAQP